MNRILRVKNLFFATVLIVAGIAASHAQTPASKYINQYRPVATALSREFGIPVSVILGVAIVESSTGAARNCQDLRNHFGIVGHNDVARHTRYKQYASSEASFRDFCGVLSRKGFYGQLRGSQDLAAWVLAISKAGYSTTPTAWQHKVSTAIHSNRL